MDKIKLTDEQQKYIDDNYKETPNLLGAHAGGNWTARKQSHQDVVDFFRKQFFS